MSVLVLQGGQEEMNGQSAQKGHRYGSLDNWPMVTEKERGEEGAWKELWTLATGHKPQGR